MVKIAIMDLRGGTGKTTLAMNIASYMAYDDTKVGLRDLDGQRSLTDLFTVYDSMGGFVESGMLELEKPDGEYKVLIADMPPYIKDNAALQLSEFDFLVIPSKYSPLELLSVRKFMNTVEAARKLNPNLKFAVVFNQVKPTAMVEEIKTAVKDLKIPFFVTKIMDRVDYSISLEFGGIFNNVEGNNGFANEKAKKEISDLVREIENILY